MKLKINNLPKPKVEVPGLPDDSIGKPISLSDYIEQGGDDTPVSLGAALTDAYPQDDENIEDFDDLTSLEELPSDVELPTMLPAYSDVLQRVQEQASLDFEDTWYKYMNDEIDAKEAAERLHKISEKHSVIYKILVEMDKEVNG